jgi:hypothetical protein
MEAEVKSRVEEILNKYCGESDWISPYNLSHAVSELVGRYVREQLVYNYINKLPKPYIQATKGTTGKWQVSRTEAERWMTKFANKK